MHWVNCGFFHLILIYYYYLSSSDKSQALIDCSVYFGWITVSGDIKYVPGWFLLKYS